MLEDLEGEILEYENVGEFLADIKEEFEGGDKEEVKVTELKKLEQGSKTIEEFIQEFRKVTRRNGYEGRPLVEEFKRDNMPKTYGVRTAAHLDRTVVQLSHHFR